VFSAEHIVDVDRSSGHGPASIGPVGTVQAASDAKSNENGNAAKKRMWRQ
jgi:hypothetical protein